ncbi:MAG: methylmalonyl-CoA mutase family protein, partial [Phycisphaerales bacterium]|nr:methylmalonyl-CoA mutase family protein [Phycisphaerales bacterium]
PKWNTISISGYHVREAGCTAVQEVAFTLANGIAYVAAAQARGLHVDSFAPRLSFFFNSHNEFFEEICKLRAARRIWATAMKDRFGAKNDRSLLMRTHVQTAGCSLTEQQPLNNIVRIAYQAMSGVLGGCQSLHTDSMDETLGLPTETAVRVALRTQQILAEETGVTRVVDPLGGSWFVEALTDQMQQDADAIIAEIDDMGGVVAGIHKGYFRRSIAEASYRFGQEMEAGDRLIVGVNAFEEGNDSHQVDILQIPHAVETNQRECLTAFKNNRDADGVLAALDTIRAAAKNDDNLMPVLIDAAIANCTLGEMVQAMADVYGRYTSGPEW